MSKYITVSEYAKMLNISTVAVYKKIKNKQVETKKENNKIYIKVDKVITQVSNQESEANNQVITSLQTEIKLLKSSFEAEKRVNQENQKLITELTEHKETLKLTCNLLERENKRLLQLQAPQNAPTKSNENIIIKQTPKAQKTKEPQDEKPQDLKIELSKKLLTDGLNEKERKRVKARFNKRIGERGIIKEQGKMYISKTENYEDLLKV